MAIVSREITDGDSVLGLDIEGLVTTHSLSINFDELRTHNEEIEAGGKRECQAAMKQT
jgi:hypothetical protein